jgi:hypothetical protein
MSCAADRGDFPAWAGRVVDPLEEITPEADAAELATRILKYFESYKMAAFPMVVAQLEKALDQEYRRGVEEAREAIGAALRYRPISPDETR